jgi:hypothetical protein
MNAYNQGRSRSPGVRTLKHISEWSDISTCGLLSQWASTINIQLNEFVCLAVGRYYHHIIVKTILDLAMILMTKPLMEI